MHDLSHFREDSLQIESTLQNYDLCHQLEITEGSFFKSAIDFNERIIVLIKEFESKLITLSKIHNME